MEGVEVGVGVVVAIAVLVGVLVWIRGRQSADPTTPGGFEEEDSSYRWQGLGFGFGPRE